MKGRLTLDKVNAAINDMAAYADANAQLIAAPRKKVPLHLFFFSFTFIFMPITLIVLLFSFSEAEWEYLGKSFGE